MRIRFPAVQTLGVVLGMVWLLGVIGISSNHVVFGSPDEAANSFFMTHLADNGSFTYDPGGPSSVTDYFHPRSVYVHAGKIVPGSFLGFLFLGAAAEKVATGARYYVVPLLALAALVALYKLFREFWNPSWSLLGVALVGFHPAWLEFQTLPMYHNGAFASLLIIAAYALKRLHREPGLAKVILFSLAYGAALFVRPSEVLWTGPLVAIVLLTMPGGWRWFLASIGMVVLIQLPWMIASHSLYGSLLATAYTPAENVETVTTTSAGFWHIFLTPAGGHGSWRFLSSALWYLLLLVPAWSAMALVSLSRYFRKKFVLPNKAIKLSLASLLILYVLWFYGSWDLYPASTSAEVGPLASYVRYWLPLYVAMSAGVILFLKSIWLRSRGLTIALMALLFVSQGSLVFGHPTAGLVSRYHQTAKLQTIRQTLLAQTEPSSLIIAGKFDVLLFPERLVGFRLPEQEVGWLTLRDVAKTRPVYLVGTPRQYRQEDLTLQLRQHGLDLGVAQPVGENTLWSILAL